MTISQVVLSSDVSDRFLNFWPLASRAWKEIVGFSPVLALVTDDLSGQVVDTAREFGQVFPIKADPRFPIANQAKLARFYAAAALDGPSLIEDIDTCPLNNSYPSWIVRSWNQKAVLAVGADVYQGTPYEGSFPISNLTASPDHFRELFRIKDLDFRTWLTSLMSMDHTNRTHPLSFTFSDEQLIRILRSSGDTTVPFQELNREIDGDNQWLNRSLWSLDRRKLRSDGYLYANFPRPIHAFRRETFPVVEHLFGEWARWFFDNPLIAVGATPKPKRLSRRPWIKSMP